MKIIYCENWHRSKKIVRRPIDINESIRRFEFGEHFFAVLYENNNPVSFLEFFSEGAIGVSFLDDNLNEISSYTYQIIKEHKKINPHKLFLVRLIEREINNDEVQVKGTAYSPVLYSNGEWVIQHNLYCEEDDFVKKESSSFYSEKKVDICSLYKEIPLFGEWLPLITGSPIEFLEK